MPAGNWLLPEHHHRVQHLPLVAMFHAQHFKPSLAHDVGELLWLLQPESLPVPPERPHAGGGPEDGRPAAPARRMSANPCGPYTQNPPQPRVSGPRLAADRNPPARPPPRFITRATSRR